MIERANEHAGERVRFTLDDATSWKLCAPVDVLVCNATLHWVDGHDALAARWLEFLTPGGWLAFQVPGNFNGPSHMQITEQLAESRWRDALPAGTSIRRIVCAGTLSRSADRCRRRGRRAYVT